jgi:transcriptional regulator with XRE-family HTH domain
MGEMAVNLGERIRNRRIEAGLTQARLAHAAGVSRRHLAALEKGANVSLGILARVSQVLVIPPSVLFQTDFPSFPNVAPVRYASVFISYGAPDELIARRLYNDLTAAGVSCFFFPVSATPGAKLGGANSTSKCNAPSRVEGDLGH